MNRKLQKECESSCEYILPDYLGDVKKLISTSAKVVPSGQFEGDGVIDCAGIVAYDVVYLDSENKLSSASFSSDYDFSLGKNDESYKDAYVSSSVGNFTIRLTGPRRMIAKAYVSSSVTLMESFEPSVLGNVFGESEEPEKITESLEIESSLKGESLEREYAEEIASLEGISADEIEVITSSAYVRISESIPVEDGVNIKGELVITAIIRTPDTSVFAIRREIPFDETVSVNGANRDMSAISDAFVSSLSLAINDEEGASQVVANVIMELGSQTYFNESVEIVKDAYLKTKETVAEYKNLDFSKHVTAETKSGSINIKMPLAELDLGSLKEVLSLCQDFRGLTLENDGKNPKFVGEIAFSGVACEILEGEEENITSLKFNVPVSIDVNIGCQIPEKSELYARILPAGVDWELDDENLSIKLWYTVTFSLGEVKDARCLASCDVVGDFEYARTPSKISVYFPSESESLFDIAKKFHTSVKDIAADNMISEPTALGIPSKSGFKKLIIR